jgi:hypothetical protein
MPNLNDPVLSAVLALSPEERVKLADHLLEKLQSAHAFEIDPDEVENRIEALRSGDPERLQELQSAVRA